MEVLIFVLCIPLCFIGAYIKQDISRYDNKHIPNTPTETLENFNKPKKPYHLEGKKH